MLQSLRTAWAKVLDLEESDIDDESSFFDLGGDSVGAIRLVEVARELGVAIDVQMIFEHPELADLVSVCQEVDGKAEIFKSQPVDEAIVEACANVCRVGRDEIEDVFPTTELQARLFEAHRTEGSYTIQVVMEVEGKASVDLLQHAWGLIQEKNQILRTAIAEHGNRLLQVILRKPVVWQAKDNLAEYMAADAKRRFDFGDYLFRYAIIREKDQTFFVWTANHAGFDVWTRRLMYNDLQAALLDIDAFAAMPSRPPFKRFTEWQVSQDRERAKDFWRDYLSGFDSLGNLFSPAIAPAPTAARMIGWLPLEKLRKSAHSMTTMAYAAWTLTLGNVSGFDDILFITVRSGRQVPVPGVESVQGPLFSASPFRIQISPDETINDFLDSIQRRVTSAIPYEAFGVAEVIKHVGTQNYRQSIFNFHPSDDETFTRAFNASGGEKGMARIQVREDLSTSFEMTIPLIIDMYDIKGRLKVSFRWDETKFTQDRINHLKDTFLASLTKIASLKYKQVKDLRSGEKT